jgi:RNA polymerase sigma factor (sigma-70 family)
MPAAPVDALWHSVRQLLESQRTGHLSDRALLRRFADRRDEAAFAALVERHGPMVLGVCRRLLHQEQDAEDVFQAVFLVLARKAAGMRWHESISNWLHGVARRLSLKVRGRAARRSVPLGRTTPGTTPDPLEEITGRELLAVLDDELARLPQTLRGPVLLCFLQGSTQEEAARQLGWSLSTLRRRLERGRQALRTRLARRGFALPAALFAGALASNAAAAVPATLTVATLRAAQQFTTGPAAGALAGPLVALAEGALKPLWLARVGTAAGLLLLTGVLATGAYRVARPAPRPEPAAPATTRPVERPAAAQKQAPTDRHGDPLPPGALARLGTARFRHRYAQVAFAPDGKTLLSAGDDQAVRIWDVKTGKQVEHRPLLLPGQSSTSAFSTYLLAADATTVLGWGPDERLHLWDTATGKHLRSLRSSKGQVMRLALAPGGKTVAAGIYDVRAGHTVILWDTATGKERHRLDHRQELLEELAFSPDGKLLATGSSQALRFWDTASGKEIRKLRGQVHSLRFSPDGKTLATGLYDGTVKLWDVADGKAQATLGKATRKPIGTLAFSRDGRALAAASQKDVTLWDLGTRKELRKLPAQGWLAFAPDGKTLASSAYSTIQLWDVATGKPLHPPHGHKGEVGSVVVSPDGKVLASISWVGNTVHLWDTTTGKPRAVLRGHQCYARISAFSADGKLLVSGAGDGTVRLWNVAGGKELRTFRIAPPQGEKGWPHVMDVRLSPDGKQLAALSMAGDTIPRTQVSVWETATGKLLAQRPFRGGFRTSWLSPDGRSVALTTSKGLCLEDTATGRELVTISGGGGGPHDPMTFSADGKLVAAAIYPPGPRPGMPVAPGTQPVRMQGIGLWELATGQQILRLETGAVGHIAFSPDGRLLATADPSALRLWDLATGKQLYHRSRHENFRGSHGEAFVSSLTFLAQGDVLATGLADSTILVWDLEPRTWRTGLSVKDPGPKGLERLWADLGAQDAARAHRALETLAAVPAQAVPFLKERLRPAAAIDARRVERLLAELDSERFAVREAASRELAGLGEQVAPALLRVLAGKPSLEVHKRVDRLLGSAILADRGTVRSGPVLRTLRSIRLLERLGTPPARRVLQKLAAGPPAARTTREAKEALDRLAGRLRPGR